MGHFWVFIANHRHQAGLHPVFDGREIIFFRFMTLSRHCGQEGIEAPLKKSYLLFNERPSAAFDPGAREKRPDSRYRATRFVSL